MTLQELRFLVALAREKHFRKASEVCFVSQPSLSIAIRKLEEDLGVILFERIKNDVRITPIGKQIVDHAKRVLAEVDVLKQTANQEGDPLAGVLKLGAIFTVGPYLLPPLITQLQKIAPQLPIEIQEDYTTNLREKLVNGDVDVIMISQPFSAPGVVTRNLYKEPFVVLMPSNHPLARYKSVNEKALSQYRVLMLGEGHCFRDQIVSSCPTCFIPNASLPETNWHTVEASSLETIRHMIAAGMGLTILPTTAATAGAYRSNMLTTRPLRAEHPNRVISLAWRSSFPRIKAIEVILKAIARCSLEGAVML